MITEVERRFDKMWERVFNRFALLGRATLVIFCLWHLLAITLVQFPRSTAFRNLPQEIFGSYLALTGTWQHWGMFTSRPYIQTLDISLRAYLPGGRIERLDPLLPSFLPIGDDVRVHYLFLMGVTGQSDFLEEYLKRCCLKFTEMKQQRPESFSIVARYGYTRAFSYTDPHGSEIENLELEYKKVVCP